MKESKKTLLALASVCLLMAGAGATLITSADESEAIDCGDWKYSKIVRMDSTTVATLDRYCGSETNITIPSTIDGYTVESLTGTFQNNTNIVSVIIPDTVTFMSYTFDGCTGLTSVIMSDNLIDLGVYAFRNCVALTSITIPDGVTLIGLNAFYGCTGLTSITIPSSVTEMQSGAFYGCTGLTSVTIPYGVETIANAFNNCTGLTSVTIPYGVTKVGRFDNCTSLTSITIPSSVTQISYMAFFTCTNLSKAYVHTSTTIEDYAFPTTTEVVFYDIFTINFDSMGGNAIQSIERMTGEEYGDLPVPTKDGYSFDGWYYTEWNGAVTGPVGSNWTAFMDLTLWAKWTQLLEIPYTEPSNAIASINWNWTPTTLSGAVVTVSGVDWLSVNGTNVYGVPPAPGEYTITVTIAKDGYADRTETCTLNVVSMLVVLNSPSFGIMAYQV